MLLDNFAGKLNEKGSSLAFLLLKIVITISLFLLYMVSFQALYYMFGEVITMLLLIPVCVSAWMWKLKIGTALALLVIPIHGYLFISVGLIEKKSFIEGVPSFITTMLLAALTGWLSEVSVRYKTLAGEYFQKHKDLENEITRRKEIENELSLINANLGLIVEKRTEELLAAKIKAEESDRLKSDFLTQMSHEVRTPLSNILNYTSILKELTAPLDDEMLAICFYSIDQNAKRLIRTIEMIINISQLHQKKYCINPKLLNPDTDVLQTLILERDSDAAEKGIRLIYESADIPCTIKADEYSLRQIFDNLLDNAIKFTMQGHVLVKTAVDKCEYSVTISDTGIGISPEYIRNLFDPFTQEEQGYSRRYEGNGLGLAIVKGYCELNAAEISVETKKDIGTTFFIKFKCQAQQPLFRSINVEKI